MPAASAWIVYMIRYKDPWRATYEAQLDSFLHWKFAVAPCLALAVFVNEGHFSSQPFFTYLFEV